MIRASSWAVTTLSAGTCYNAYEFAQKEEIPLSAVPLVAAVKPYHNAFLQLTGRKAGLQAVPIRQAVSIVESFQAREFDCADGLFGLEKNKHWQTIVGTGALRKAITGKDLPERNIEVISERFRTRDGDFYDVDFSKVHFAPDAPKELLEAPIVIILHGLEATYRGGMTTKMAEEFLAQGFAPVFYSFRGCSGALNQTPGAYHVGFTLDINELTVELKLRYPNRKMYLSGFSLGGNVSLKYLGQLGNRAAADRHIFGAVTMSVPYDATGAGAAIDDGINKYIYAANFLKTLKKKAEIQHKLYPDAFDIGKVRAAQTIGEFDNAYIAAIYRYKDQFDYYTQNGSKAWIPKIRVPVVSINAKDDPFIPEKTLPDPVKDVENAPVRLIYTQHGGHCGFVASPRSRQQQASTPVNAGSGLVATEARKDISGNDDRWIAVEMARALKHIHTESERIMASP